MPAIHNPVLSVLLFPVFSRTSGYMHRFSFPAFPVSVGSDHSTGGFHPLFLQYFHTAPCIVNGANEVAVAAFLAGKIGFLEIGALAQQAMASIPATAIKTYEDVMKADTQAREFVRNAIA